MGRSFHFLDLHMPKKLTSSIILSISYQKFILQRRYIILEGFNLVIVDGSTTRCGIDRDAAGRKIKVLMY